MGDLSTNFSAFEFKCRCGKCHLTGFEISPLLVMKLQQLRDYYKAPIIINSALRCEEYNDQIGGKKGSRHLTGEAVDIQCAFSGMRHQLVRLAMLLNFGGIGVGGNFLHLDVRPIKEAHMWLY